MASFYQAFLSHHIDLSPLGMDLKASGAPYPCTPKGATILGWAGIDGIHYCRLRGWGEAIFVVDPSNGEADAVHPLARNFQDLLRLILYTQGADALAQAWQWDQAQFEAYCRQRPVGEAQRAVLDRIAGELGLSPMDHPWRYIRQLQAEFDASAPAFPRQPQAAPPLPWKVYFHGGFGSGVRYERAGREIPVERRFCWHGETWYIPAVYACGAGLVIDFLRRVPAGDIRDFIARWRLTPDSGLDSFTPEEQLQIEAEQPFSIDFHPRLQVNGSFLEASQGCGMCWNPVYPEGNNDDVKRALRHYRLDPQDGWSIMRWRFPWKAACRPKLKRLFVTLSADEVALPGACFTAAVPGDRIFFTDPVSGGAHTLTIQSYQPERLEASFQRSVRQGLPACFVSMGYTVSPPLPEGRLAVIDTVKPDPSHLLTGDEGNDTCCAVGIIGGADGPVALFLSADHSDLQYTASALHHEPVSSVTWRMIFYRKTKEDITVPLI